MKSKRILALSAVSLLFSPGLAPSSLTLGVAHAESAAPALSAQSLSAQEMMTQGLSAPAPAAAVSPFALSSVDDRLRRNVDFWIKIYSQYGSSQGVVHDARYVDKIYEVVDARGSSANAAKRKWRSTLLSLHKKWLRNPDRGMPGDLTEDEAYAYRLFEDINEPDKFLKATLRKRLRFQLGQKDAFIDGIHQSGRFLPFMEEAFRKEGLPVELTRLPFVESSFNMRARSKVGASGIWQFMRSTGRLFMVIDESVDERNDPVRATEAAARLLKLNYESLKSWPLAVTAYNHGRKGMMRAVVKVGSNELSDIIANYRSRSFGFASSNFYPELLAAIEVEKNAERYFGTSGLVTRGEPYDFIEMKIPDRVRIPVLTRFLKLDPKRVKELNPGLSEAALQGTLLIPAGYSLRLPPPADKDRDSARRFFFAGYSAIPSVYKKGSRSNAVAPASLNPQNRHRPVKYDKASPHDNDAAVTRQ